MKLIILNDVSRLCAGILAFYVVLYGLDDVANDPILIISAMIFLYSLGFSGSIFIFEEVFSRYTSHFLQKWQYGILVPSFAAIFLSSQGIRAGSALLLVCIVPFFCGFILATAYAETVLFQKLDKTVSATKRKDVALVVAIRKNIFCNVVLAILPIFSAVALLLIASREYAHLLVASVFSVMSGLLIIHSFTVYGSLTVSPRGR